MYVYSKAYERTALILNKVTAAHALAHAGSLQALMYPVFNYFYLISNLYRLVIIYDLYSF